MLATLHAIAIALTYLGIHFFLSMLISQGMLETILLRSAHPTLMAVIVIFTHVFKSFVAALATTVLARWYLSSPEAVMSLLLISIFPAICAFAAARIAIGREIGITLQEALSASLLALGSAYLAVRLGLGLQMS